MAGLGYGAMFGHDPDPNPMMIPPTGAVLNDQGTPEWEEQYPEFANVINSPVYNDRLHSTNTNLMGELENVEKQLHQLIKHRSELIEKIVAERDALNYVIEKSKKLTDDLSLLELMEEPMTLEGEVDG